MSDVKLDVVYVDQSFPAGTALGSIVATLTPATDSSHPLSQTVSAGTASITFASVPADTYEITLQQLDGNGAALGAALTGTVVVPVASTVTLSVPSSVTATVV